MVVPAVKWLTLLMAHIPDKHEHLVRYYGWYSNRARGERKDDENTNTTSTLHLDQTPLDRTSKANGARLIQKVSALAGKYVPDIFTRICPIFVLLRSTSCMQSYEVDPLACPQCHHTMRIIDDTAVIRSFLKHLRRWDPIPEQPEHPACDPQWPTNTTIPLTYHTVPDIA